MEEKLKKREFKAKWLLAAAAGICILAAAAIFLLGGSGGSADVINIIAKTPMLTIETPQKLSLEEDERFTLKVTVSDLGEAIYPAASMSISFDSSKLEFTGIKEGNVFVRDNDPSSKSGRKLPDWGYNVQASNADGMINIMYLDVSGGKCAFDRQLLNRKNDVVLRLCFRFRGSVSPDDILELAVEDAVFAASDESQSLASTTGSLKTRNGRIVVTE